MPGLFYPSSFAPTGTEQSCPGSLVNTIKFENVFPAPGTYPLMSHKVQSIERLKILFFKIFCGLGISAIGPVYKVDMVIGMYIPHIT